MSHGYLTDIINKWLCPCDYQSAMIYLSKFPGKVFCCHLISTRPECSLLQSFFPDGKDKVLKKWLKIGYYLASFRIIKNNFRTVLECIWLKHLHVQWASTEHQFATLHCTRDSSQCSSPFQFILCQENEYFLNSRGTILFLMYCFERKYYFQTKSRYLKLPFTPPLPYL